jgi:2-dehydropantoate 2-reductase
MTVQSSGPQAAMPPNGSMGKSPAMEVLLIGAGVIGTVYVVQLASAGHHVSVLRHGPRTDEVARDGLVCHDVNEATPQRCAVAVVSDTVGAYDLVLVAVRADQVRTAMEPLQALSSAPVVLVFGNNPGGTTALDNGLPGTIRLGFPGIGGAVRNGVAEYMRITQQPTTLEACADPAIATFEAALAGRGFKVTRSVDINGWLIHHAVFVASIAAALYRHAGDPVALADDRPVVMLMCRAIEEGFRALRHDGVEGAPINLRILHHRNLRPFAARYWSRTMRSPTGERIFAAHARHAEHEMHTLATQVLNRLHDAPNTDNLRRLLNTT